MNKKHIFLPEEYLKDVLVRLAHHSSAMEGNTISLPDTVSIILYNTIPGKVNLREFYEIENHKQAFHFLIESITDDVVLSISVIKEIHELLTDRLQYDKGQFKKNQNAIIGADFQTATPAETPHLMEQWVDNLNFRLSRVTTNRDIVELVTDFHIQFERIHPFSDGNGRTGRMLMNYTLLKNGLPPLIIPVENKAEYVNCLAKEDVKQLCDLSMNFILNEAARLQQFLDKENESIKLEKEFKELEDREN